jgi:outer membrane protein OmpA-like peptidoglycan-associated protein
MGTAVPPAQAAFAIIEMAQKTADDTIAAAKAEADALLADARAKTVGTYLSSMGIPVVQVQMKGYGATKPVATNSTPAGRQFNRRVDVYISR